MNTRLRAVCIGILCFGVYFWTATRGTLSPKWARDYFNPLAASIIRGRLDIENPADTYDLVHFQGKWYAPWGILPAALLVPIQLVKGRFIPPLYLSLFFGSLNVVLFYLLIERVRKDFFPSMRIWEILFATVLFAFGTTNFYVSTLGSVWHVDQIVSAALGTLGLLIIFRKKRTPFHYILSSMVFGLALLGRATIILTIAVSVVLFVFEKPNDLVRKGWIYFGIPCCIFSALFFWYNYARFGSIFEYGYHFIMEAQHLQSMREQNGIMSFSNLRHNLWYFLFEIPMLTLSGKPELRFNLLGNSIFFVTPPFLAAFLVSVNRYTLALWLGVLVTIVPSLMIYSTGWMQFGYRYSLDITPMLVLLSIFGMRGRLNVLYLGGTVFALWMYWMGINALM